MMKVNVNTTPTLTIIVETFRSDKKYFGQTKPISLSDRMTDRSSDNLAQTGILQFYFNTASVISGNVLVSSQLIVQIVL